MKNDTRLSTAGAELNKAKARLKSAEDAEWDNPTPKTARVSSFWAGQVAEFSAMQEDEVIPLF